MEPIICRICKTPIKFPDNYDTEDFAGELECQECTSVIYVKIVKSKVQRYKVIKEIARGMTQAERLQIVQIVDEARKEVEEEDRELLESMHLTGTQDVNRRKEEDLKLTEEAHKKPEESSK